MAKNKVNEQLANIRKSLSTDTESAVNVTPLKFSNQDFIDFAENEYKKLGDKAFIYPQKTSEDIKSSYQRINYREYKFITDLIDKVKSLGYSVSIQDEKRIVEFINANPIQEGMIPSIYIDSLVKDLDLKEIGFEHKALTTNLNYMVGGGAITSGCKALRDRNSWTSNPLGEAIYEHHKADKSNSCISHYINDWKNSNEIKLIPYSEAEQILEKFGVYPALFHLILAVHFYRQDNPLSANLRLRGTDLIKDLGLDKRSDLSKSKKLNIVLEIVTAVRSLIITAKWSSNVLVKKGKKYEDKEVFFEFDPSIMWDISPLKITEKDLFGNEDLIELDIRVKAGTWLGHFFNKSGREIGKSLFNFATLSRKILDLDPYHEELALRIALLQSTMDYRNYYTVEQWLIENLPGAKDKISKAKTDREVRRNLTNLWDKTLIALERIGFSIFYEAETYPENLRPNSPKKPYKYFDPLLLAKVKLTPEALGKPDNIKPVKQIEEKVYSGLDLKSKREALGLTQSMIAKYLFNDAKKKMVISRIEKTQILTKEKYNEVMDAINYVNKYQSKFK